MAYPTVDKPYGLKPINLYGGTPLRALLASTGLLRHTTLEFFTVMLLR